MYYKITQTRSIIGMPPKIRGNIKSLGLKKRCQTVYRKVSLATANQILKVKELVSVDLVDNFKSEEEMKKEKKFPLGFEILKQEAFKNRYC